jgi:hypothetical protein
MKKDNNTKDESVLVMLIIYLAMMGLLLTCSLSNL